MFKYEEIRCIGRGSYGSAHLVTEHDTNERFVIKKIPMELLSESEKQQSFREVELLAKLKHPNVVEYKENFVENNVIHIVMAYCDGGDLAGRIKERAAIEANGGHGYFDVRQILDWFVQMAMAIKYLHEQRILHRDLKSSNIFLTTQNVIKLGDFGIAKTLDSTLDQAKTVVGTPYYMSPEVCESKPYSYSSDVWSLGCVLYEMVALKHAFDAPNILTLILKIVQNDFAAIPAHYDPEISEVLRRLLDKRPENRPTMDQIFAMPYIRSHMQALMESGGSLKITMSARRVRSIPKRKQRNKVCRRPATGASRMLSRGSPSGLNRWAAISPNDQDDILAGECSDLELLDVSENLGNTAVDIRQPERSRTPEPLVGPIGEESISERQSMRSPQTTTITVEETGSIFTQLDQVPDLGCRGRSNSGEVREEIDGQTHLETAEAMMNPNFQRVYAEECDDSLTVKYAPQMRRRSREQPKQYKPGRKVKGRCSAVESPASDTLRRQVFGNLGDDAREIAPRARPSLSSAEYAQFSETLSASTTLSLSLDDADVGNVDIAKTRHSEAINLSESNILRQLQIEHGSSEDEIYCDDCSSNSDNYEGEENFYSEHSAYSDDSDFVADENDAEYSDDFEDLDGEVIEYANDDFVTEDVTMTDFIQSDGLLRFRGVPTTDNSRTLSLASSPASRRPPREVQLVMRNVAQSLMESYENLRVT